MGVDAVMYVTGMERFTQEQADELAFDLGDAFYADTFFNDDAEPGKAWSRRVRAVTLKELPEDPEELQYLMLPVEFYPCYEINLFHRYYGIDYERGNLPLILSIGCWFTTRFPICTVWYGGDSDDHVRPLPEIEDELWQHFCRVGHLPYSSYFDNEKDGPICCGHRMIRYGWGGDYAAWTCHGCGMKVTRRNGQVVRSRLDRDHPTI